MKITSKIILMLFATLMLSASMNAQNQKIGYLITEQLVAELPDFKSANSQLETLATQLKKQLTAKEDKIRQKVQDAEGKAQSLSPAEIKAIQEDLAKDQQALYADEQAFQKQLVDKEKELLDPIYKKVQSAIQSVAKSNGYSYILEGSSLMYAVEADDVMPLVKQQLGM